MKAFNTVMKLLAALAAVAGAVYVVATYGDKIVAWAKKLWSTLPQCPEVPEDTQSVVEAETVETEEPAEAPAAEEAPAVAEAPVQESAPQIPETDPVADEADFAE